MTLDAPSDTKTGNETPLPPATRTLGSDIDLLHGGFGLGPPRGLFGEPPSDQAAETPEQNEVLRDAGTPKNGRGRPRGLWSNPSADALLLTLSELKAEGRGPTEMKAVATEVSEDVHQKLLGPEVPEDVRQRFRKWYRGSPASTAHRVRLLRREFVD